MKHLPKIALTLALLACWAIGASAQTLYHSETLPATTLTTDPWVPGEGYIFDVPYTPGPYTQATFFLDVTAGADLWAWNASQYPVQIFTNPEAVLTCRATMYFDNGDGTWGQALTALPMPCLAYPDIDLMLPPFARFQGHADKTVTHQRMTITDSAHPLLAWLRGDLGAAAQVIVEANTTLNPLLGIDAATYVGMTWSVVVQ
jgi:hypothetical protein